MKKQELLALPSNPRLILSVTFIIALIILQITEMFVTKNSKFAATHYELFFRLGQIIGTIIFIFILPYCTRNKLLLILLFVVLISFTFLLTLENIPSLCSLVSLIISGTCSIIIHIYAPLWNKALGVKRYKNIFHYLIILSMPIGKGIFSLFSESTNYKCFFYLEMFILLICVFIIIFIQKDSFLKNVSIAKQTQYDKKRSSNCSYFEVGLRNSFTSNTSNRSSKLKSRKQIPPICILIILLKIIIAGVSGTVLHYMKSNISFVETDENNTLSYTKFIILAPLLICSIFLSIQSASNIHQSIKWMLIFIIMASLFLLPSSLLVNNIIFNLSLHMKKYLFIIMVFFFRTFVLCAIPTLDSIMLSVLNNYNVEKGYGIGYICQIIFGSCLIPKFYNALGKNEIAYLYLSIYFLIFACVLACIIYMKGNTLKTNVKGKGETGKRKRMESDAMEELSVDVNLNRNDEHDFESDKEEEDNVYNLKDIGRK